MPPTLKKLWGHVGLVLSISLSQDITVNIISEELFWHMNLTFGIQYTDHMQKSRLTSWLAVCSIVRVMPPFSEN